MNCSFIYLHLQVSYMESKVSEGKKKKVEFIEKAKEHEQVIQGLRSALGDSLSYLEKQGGSVSSVEETPRLSKSLPVNMSPSAAPSTSSFADKYGASRSFHTPGSKRPYSVGHSSGYGTQGRYSSYSAAKGHPRSHI